MMVGTQAYVEGTVKKLCRRLFSGDEVLSAAVIVYCCLCCCMLLLSPLSLYITIIITVFFIFIFISWLRPVTRNGGIFGGTPIVACFRQQWAANLKNELKHDITPI